MSEQQPAYQPGQIVNGHVWTGTEWLPVQIPEPPPPYVTQTLSEQLNSLPKAARVAILLVLLSFGAAIFYFIIWPFIVTIMLM